MKEETLWIQICLFLNFNLVFLKNYTKTSTVNLGNHVEVFLFCYLPSNPVLLLQGFANSLDILGGKAAGVFKISGIKPKHLRDTNPKSKYPT